MIVVDTSIWSQAFRRSRREALVATLPAVRVLEQLITEHQPIAMPGIVFQELLSGVRTKAQFDRLHTDLGTFPLLLADRADHVEAARIVNACMSVGIAVASIDALIAAITILRGGYLLTSDSDFERIAECSELHVRLVEQ